MVDLTNEYYEEELIYIMILVHGISIAHSIRYHGFRKNEIDYKPNKLNIWIDLVMCS